MDVAMEIAGLPDFRKHIIIRDTTIHHEARLETPFFSLLLLEDLLFHLHHLQDSHTVPTIQNAPDRASAYDSAVRIRGLHFDYGLSARKWWMISPWSLVWVVVLMEVDWHAFPGRKADCPLFFHILVEYFQIQMNTFETFFCFPMFS